MTMERTLPPPVNRPYFKCSRDDCDNKWQAYHGKVGCLCYECDNLTSESMLKNKPEIKNERD